MEKNEEKRVMPRPNGEANRRGASSKGCMNIGLGDGTLGHNQQGTLNRCKTRDAPKEKGGNNSKT